MTRLALRNLAAHAGRYGMSLLAVVLGIAFLSGTMQLREGISQAFDELFAFQFDADAYVVPARDGQPVLEDDWAGGPVDQAVPLNASALAAAVEGVDRVVADVRGAAILAGADGTPIAGTGAGGPGLGLSWDSADGRADLRLSVGRAPAAPGEVAVMDDTASRGDLALGDATTVFTGAQVADVTVVGIMESDAAGFLGASLTFFPARQALDLYAPGGGVARLAVHSESLTAPALVERLNAALDGDETVAVSGDRLREDYKAEMRDQIGAIGALLSVFAVVALLIGGFVIFNTFSIAVRQETARYALLRSLGGSGAQVSGLVLVQGAVIGAIGSALGILAGKGLATLAMRGFGAIGISLGDRSGSRWSDIVLALAVGVAATGLAAAVPARRAARIAPIEALRQADSEFGQPLRLRAWLGGAMLAAGAGLAAAGAAADPASGRLVALGALGLVGGAVVAGPALTAGAGRAASAVLDRLWRPAGRLAARNLRRNPRRGAATASALMIGLALVSAAAVAANSMRASTVDKVAEAMKADLVLSGVIGGPLPQPVVPAAAGIAGVARVDSLLVGLAQADGLPVAATSVPTAAIGDTIEMDWAGGSDWAPLQNGQLMVRRAAARERGWQVGDAVSLSGEAGAAELGIGGLYQRGLGGEDVMMSAEVFERVVGPPGEAAYQALIRFEAGADAAAVRQRVAAAVAPFMVVSVQDRAELMAENGSMVDTILAAAYALLALSVVVAVLGVVNTMALSVIERRREFGLLRAIGLARARTAATVVLESVLLAAGGAVTGAAIGAGIGAALARCLRDQGMTELAIPLGQLALIVALGLVAGAVAAITPAVR
ncbi:MAG: ABC transporter permease, partial [Bifidobacteriaceae bacterium]|nr:ABC transporter permease [Bifidobacteriaceae bacterium]